MCVCVDVCLHGFCNVWLCVFVNFVMFGYFDNCLGVLVICVLVFTVLSIACPVFLDCFLCIFIPIYFVCTSVRPTTTE
jgi:hypothetical protein